MILKILAIVLFITIFGCSFFFEYYEEGIKEVDCYDKFGNKIIGERCIEKITSNDVFLERCLDFFGFFILAIITSLMVWSLEETIK